MEPARLRLDSLPDNHNPPARSAPMVTPEYNHLQESASVREPGAKWGLSRSGL